jgi:hypothetical protein
MHDNKVRLSQDVLEKAERIATEWGLKNARAAVEAVFRKYCDDYLYGRFDTANGSAPRVMVPNTATYSHSDPLRSGLVPGKLANQEGGTTSPCEALDEPIQAVTA